MTTFVPLIDPIGLISSYVHSCHSSGMMLWEDPVRVFR